MIGSLEPYSAGFGPYRIHLPWYFWFWSNQRRHDALCEGVLAGVLFSYSHADEALRDQLEKQLPMLKRQGVIDTWHDRRIGADQEIAYEIDEQINRDEIILLLVSADFLASNYCYNIEMKRAMERHEAGEAIVIPIILRACDWYHAPFGKLNAVPREGNSSRSAGEMSGASAASAASGGALMALWLSAR